MTSTRQLAALAALLGACAPGGGGGVPCPAGLLPGDLVVTEVFADPAGEDAGGEWFEIYDATGGGADLDGLVLIASTSAGGDQVGHVMSGPVIDAGAYLVLGGTAHDLRPDHVDYGYGDDLRVGPSRGLPNRDGRLALQCGGILVDEMIWSQAPVAASLALDGRTAPDYTLNDQPASWCASTSEFATGSRGTPGTANDPCGSVTPTRCNGAAGARPVVPPAAGDLVISEYLARPSTDVGSTTGEWLELHATADVDLNGLQLGQAEPATGPEAVATVLGSADCLAVPAGGHVVLARSRDPAVNGGLPAVDHLLGFGLTDSDDGVYIGWNDQVLDVVTWVTERPRGIAVSLDPGKLDPGDNDVDASWCRAVDPYGSGQLGTPGSANPSCPLPPPDGLCTDGTGVRAIVPPAPGQLVINEYLARPSTTVGIGGEWFELLARADFDLNGVQLGQLWPAVIQTHLPSQCRRVTAGTTILVARSVDGEVNGGLPAVDIPMIRDSTQTPWGITDDDSGLFVGIDGLLLDQVTWTTTTAARSRQRDPDSSTTFCLTPATAEFLYGADNHGTPRAANACD